MKEGPYEHGSPQEDSPSPSPVERSPLALSRRSALKTGALATAATAAYSIPLVRSARAQVGLSPAAPVITNVTPTVGGPGTVVTITGAGFDPNPLNDCIVFDNGGILVPFMAATATPNEITAVALNQFPGAVAAPIMVHPGQGQLLDVGVGVDMWFWVGGPAANVAVAPMDFTPVPDDGSDTCWYGTLVGGQMEVTIDEPWLSGQSFTVWARAHGTVAGADEFCDLGPELSGRFPVLLPGTPFDCANVICDLIEDARDLDGGCPSLRCNAIDNMDGTATITLSFLGGTVTSGSLNVCLGF